MVPSRFRVTSDPIDADFELSRPGAYLSFPLVGCHRADPLRISLRHACANRARQTFALARHAQEKDLGGIGGDKTHNARNQSALEMNSGPCSEHARFTRSFQREPRGDVKVVVELRIVLI